MKNDKIIEALEYEWDIEFGSLGALRRGEFDQKKLERLINLLKSINWEDKQFVEKRIVSLIWYITLFLIWQKERITNEYEAKELDRIINKIEEIIEKIFGIP